MMNATGLEHFSRDLIPDSGSNVPSRATKGTPANATDDGIFSKEEHLQVIFNSAGVGIAKLSTAGQFTQVNPRLSELTGYRPDELLRMTFLDLTHPDDMQASRRWAAEFIESKRTKLEAEKRYIHKQGHTIWVRISVTAIQGPDQTILNFVTVFEDVTERRLSEDLLRNQKEVLELMAKNLPLKDTLARIVRLIEEQAPGCLSTIYLVEDGRLRLGAAPGFPDSFVQVVDGCPIGPFAGSCGAAAYFGKRIVSTDILADEPYWGDFKSWILSFGIKAAWSTPVLSKEGQTIGTVSMCWKEPKEPTQRHFELVDVATRLMGIAIERDSTERLLREQQMKMICSSKLAALGEMAAGLAHEINNPLAIIHARASQLELMADRNQLSAFSATEIAGSIQATTRRISGIIKGLRSFARDTEKEAPLLIEVESLIEDTLAFCKERFRSHSVQLQVDVRPKNLLLKCRPIQMSQVLLNLLNNSHDALEGLAEKWIRIEAVESQDEITLSVTDSGPGVPPELRERIMQPFFTTKEVSKGTGLGLSISTGLVASHGGRLWLDESAENTRFVISLPRHQEKNA